MALHWNVVNTLIKDSIVLWLKASSCAAFDHQALLSAVFLVTSTVAFMVRL